MAYFQRDRGEKNRGYDPRFRPEEYGEEPAGPGEEDRPDFQESAWDDGYDDDFDDGYDDGFDELASDGGEADLSEKEKREEQKRRFRIAAGAGDLAAVLAGVAVILVLSAFLINMIQFISSDVAQNFSLWATRF